MDIWEIFLHINDTIIFHFMYFPTASPSIHFSKWLLNARDSNLASKGTLDSA